MSTASVLFAHGSLAMPRMVESFVKAKDRAHGDALQTGKPQPVLAVDLEHPERAVKILGYVTPDGTYSPVETETQTSETT